MACLDKGVGGAQEFGRPDGSAQHVADGAVTASAHNHGQHLVIGILIIPHLCRGMQGLAYAVAQHKVLTMLLMYMPNSQLKHTVM